MLGFATTALKSAVSSVPGGNSRARCLTCSCTFLIGSGMQATELTALIKAEGMSNVKHPILDRVRQCSNEPELAADFFLTILWPGLKRPSASKAQQLAYLRSLKLQLKEHYKHNPLKPRKPYLNPLSFSVTNLLPSLPDVVLD